MHLKSLENATGLFTNVDDALWDAFAEGALALIVFGAASVLLGHLRKRSPKKSASSKTKGAHWTSERKSARSPACAAPSSHAAAASGTRSVSSATPMLASR